MQQTRPSAAKSRHGRDTASVFGCHRANGLFSTCRHDRTKQELKQGKKCSGRILRSDSGEACFASFKASAGPTNLRVCRLSRIILRFEVSGTPGLSHSNPNLRDSIPNPGSNDERIYIYRVTGTALTIAALAKRRRSANRNTATSSATSSPTPSSMRYAQRQTAAGR